MKTVGPHTGARVALTLGAMVALAASIDRFIDPVLGRPGWMLPAAVAGFAATMAARIPVGRPFRLSRVLLLGTLPALLILNSMFAFEGIHVMPTSLHFSVLFGWTLYSEGMMMLSVLVGVAVAAGFTEQSNTPARDPSMTASEIVDLLGLEPHPEGGSFIRTWADTPEDGSRGTGSAIYFLLVEGHDAAKHRVDAAEAWHHYAGAPLELTVEDDGGVPVAHILGTDLTAGQRPQFVVPANAWQSARSLGDWTLAGCTVSPAFTFDGFELADEMADEEIQD